MEQTVTVQGQSVTIHPDTTVGELKDAVGAAEGDVATYRSGGQLQALRDDAFLSKHVDDGAQISFQPAEGNIFG